MDTTFPENGTLYRSIRRTQVHHVWLYDHDCDADTDGCPVLVGRAKVDACTP
ncbi:hypothetical protein [Paraburkholderia youngii]|uniref:hypothetical protein n=1 Tax=Paraburkholderia youngii TaxID=2782701 RepID=UPI003D1EEA7D